MSGPTCSVCGERVLRGSFAGESPAPTQEIVCGMCERARPAYERARAYGPYDGALRDLIHLLKYDRVHPAAKALGRMLAEAIAALGIEAERVLVVPVPLGRGKQRQRGFNQVLEIARAARKFLGAKYELAPDGLARVRETESQTGLTRHQRRENVRGAFVASDPGSLQGKTVLVVDDVFTTGTTVSECARVLARAGAEKVYVATVARVLKSEAGLGGAEPDGDEREVAYA